MMEEKIKLESDVVKDEEEYVKEKEHNQLLVGLRRGRSPSLGHIGHSGRFTELLHQGIGPENRVSFIE